MVNEDAAIIERDDVDASGKTRLDLVDLLLHGSNHFACVGAIADDDHTADCFLSILVEYTAPKLWPQLDAGNITQCHWRSVVGPERYLFNVLQATDEPDAPHNVFGVSRLHHFGAHVVV